MKTIHDHLIKNNCPYDNDGYRRINVYEDIILGAMKTFIYVLGYSNDMRFSKFYSRV